MESITTVDTSGWEKRSLKAKVLLAQAAAEAVKFGAEELAKAVTKALAGVRHSPGTRSPYPGQLPVTKISASLSQSVKIKRIDTVTIAVYIRKDKAPYAPYVHYGTKRMKPRRFMSDTAAERRQAIINRQRYIIIGKFKEHGLDSSEFLG